MEFCLANIGFWNLICAWFDNSCCWEISSWLFFTWFEQIWYWSHTQTRSRLLHINRRNLCLSFIKLFPWDLHARSVAFVTAHCCSVWTVVATLCVNRLSTDDSHWWWSSNVDEVLLVSNIVIKSNGSTSRWKHEVVFLPESHCCIWPNVYLFWSWIHISQLRIIHHLCTHHEIRHLSCLIQRTGSVIDRSQHISMCIWKLHWTLRTPGQYEWWLSHVWYRSIWLAV